MVLSKDKTYRSLKNKGFIDSTAHSGDHKYVEYWSDGKLVLHTKLSHGSNKDIDDYLIKQMSSQCKLSKKEFADLVNCPLSDKEYEDLLRQQGLLD